MLAALAALLELLGVVRPDIVEGVHPALFVGLGLGFRVEGNSKAPKLGQQLCFRSIERQRSALGAAGIPNFDPPLNLESGRVQGLGFRV